MLSYKLIGACAGAKSEKFWWATGQSNLAYKRLTATKTLVSYSHNFTLASGAVFNYVCQVWLSSGRRLAFTCCAWLWDWLIGLAANDFRSRKCLQVTKISSQSSWTRWFFNSPNAFHTICSGQVGRIKIKISPPEREDSSILPMLFIQFVQGRLGELRSRYLLLNEMILQFSSCYSYNLSRAGWEN